MRWIGYRRVGADKAILLQADGRLPYSQIVRAIDACRAAGLGVVVATPSI